MPSPALQQYLSHLYQTKDASTQLWLDEEGRARGRYFNSSLTSAFQGVHAYAAEEGIAPRTIAYEGYARSFAANDQGLNVWRLLDHAANDHESIELDRLCRILHTINFYRQPESKGRELYLTVHTRLLAAVEGNHGAAFRRILDILELPHEHIVLQLPQIMPSQRWVLHHVADNYRRNGLRIGINAADAQQALDLLERAQPQLIKLDAGHALDRGAVTQLLEKAEAAGSRVVFKRLEHQARLDELRRMLVGHELYLQGYLLDFPKAGLAEASAPGTELARSANSV
jgi:EAL domain-containing protein (putative c-di-GMP-specific phosphodiesterase class I)